jgi:hypothetical protein
MEEVYKDVACFSSQIHISLELDLIHLSLFELDSLCCP